MTHATEDKTPEPTMLYKPGETANPEAWNRKLDTQVVEEADVAAAQADGWLTAADLAKADAAEAVKAAKPAKA